MDVLAALHHYTTQHQPQQIEALASGDGLSGADIWRLLSQDGPLCLRRWPPEHPSPARLTWIHSVLRQVQRDGITFVPVPLAARDGHTFIAHAGRLWELAPWMAGKALDASEVTVRHITAAFAALARFHIAAATSADVESRYGPAPAVQQRLDKFEQLLSQGGADHIERCAEQATPAVSRHSAPMLKALRQRGPAIEHQLRALTASSLALQPCIRDIHNRHVLFENDRVTGLIDFGAMRVDNVATDLARLLGTLAGDDASMRAAGLAAYQSCRPLSQIELRLVEAIDRANVVLSGPQWLQWLLVEGKTFPLPAVQARLEAIRRRLG